MSLHRILSALMFSLLLSVTSVSFASAQSDETDHSATGGAQNLEDILARQRGEKVDNSFRSDAIGDPSIASSTNDQLGTLGGVSDPELWRAMRFGTADITASNAAPGSNLLVQDGGMKWLEFREGPLRKWGGYALLGMLGLLALFYLLRGKVMIESGRSGVTIERFKPLERFGHWVMAGSFILLGVTGLISLFGRLWLIPAVGKETYAPLALWSKWVHNNVSWAFMLSLCLVLVMWIAHNIPNRHDVVWLLKGGGLFSKHSHPPSRKFNAGQKIIFWGVILLGFSVSISGLSLLFPFELPMFAKTFALINKTGIQTWFGYETLPTILAPHAEMQLAQSWHSIVAFAMMVMIFAHIYIGTVGMEGAYEAMGTGQVDTNWAKEHHNLWVAEVEEAAKNPPKAPSALAVGSGRDYLKSLSFLAVGIIALGSWIILNNTGFSSSERQAGDAVRLTQTDTN